MGQKFYQNHSISHIFFRYKHFSVCNFLQKIRKFKMAVIFGETIFFKIGMATLQRYPVVQKNLSISLYFAQFLRYKHFCVLQLLRKIRKGHRFRQDKNFWKNVS